MYEIELKSSLEAIRTRLLERVTKYERMHAGQRCVIRGEDIEVSLGWISVIISPR